MKDNYNVIMTAVSKYGLSLMHASAKMQAKREFVTAAVTEWGIALNFAASHLQGDRELVMTAVSNDAASLMYASAELKEELFEFACFMCSTLIGMRITLMSGRQAILVLDDGLSLESFACALTELALRPPQSFEKITEFLSERFSQ